MSTHSPSPSYDIDTWSQPFYPGDRSSVTPSQTSVPSTVTLCSSTSSLRTQHRYTLQGTKSNVRPWLSLLLTSRSPKPELLPLYVGKDIISGVVELDLSKPETIREVRITVCLFPSHLRSNASTACKLKGASTQLTQESSTFLEISRTLARPSGKLSGQASYPFKFVLPDDVTIYESNWAMVYPVPPKFQEKGIVYIDYKIVVTVRRGRFSADNSLASDFCYLPETTAERPSILREQAYLNPTPSDIPTPTLDPGGWKLLPPVKANLIPNTTVTLQLSIANPLSFAIGTPIPLFLEVRNGGVTSFHPESIDIRLVRALITRGLSGGVRKIDMARAVLWPAQGTSLHSTKLWGEILVEKFLTPSFDFSNCSVRYSIALYPRHTPDKSEPEPLLSEEVLVTLHKAAGVVPRSQAPPGAVPQPVERKRSVNTRYFFASGRGSLEGYGR
ncbi:hypothetical protein BJY52DRAFT_1254315 [Lactarius psammicola]|nr:hypothetical protein BJY52DRAFT_1254315 [Lactarius psammicola]